MHDLYIMFLFFVIQLDYIHKWFIYLIYTGLHVHVNGIYDFECWSIFCWVCFAGFWRWHFWTRAIGYILETHVYSPVIDCPYL